MPYQEAGIVHRIFHSKWFLLLGVVILVIISVAFVRAFYQNVQIQQEIDQLKNQAAQLESKKINTLELLKYVKSPAYVEDKARTELNLVKEGEHLVVIPTNSVPSQNVGQAKEKVLEFSKSLSNPLKWWRYFFQ